MKYFKIKILRCLSLSVLASLVIYGGCILPTPQEIDLILEVHNGFRATVQPPSDSMFRLVWNVQGAAKAEIQAQKCIFDHDTSKDRATQDYPSGGGQNLYATNAPFPVNWTRIISAWHDEVNIFTYGLDRGNFHDVGHYTQMVWASTKEIGCARSLCPGQQLYTCNYYPAGNAPPYYVPYHQSPTQSCSGCLKNESCASSGPFAGKLLYECALFCENQYSNCDDLASSGYCNYFSDSCALSCNSKCNSTSPLNNVPFSSITPNTTLVTSTPSQASGSQTISSDVTTTLGAFPNLTINSTSPTITANITTSNGTDPEQVADNKSSGFLDFINQILG